MKTLTLVRHAKSSWDFDVDDKDRPLKLRGIQDAHLVSSHVKDKLLAPEVVFSSIANRALHTCAIFTRNLNLSYEKVNIVDDMYDFSGSLLIETIKSCDDEITNLMVFGHNYAITSFVNIYGSTYIDNVPTSGVVVIKFDVSSWEEIDSGDTVLTVFPKDLK